MMTTKAKVLYSDQLAGYLEKTDTGYRFTYDSSYLKSEKPKPISQTLPLVTYPYNSSILFPFFDGLIPEGWPKSFSKGNWEIPGQPEQSI